MQDALEWTYIECIHKATYVTSLLQNCSLEDGSEKTLSLRDLLTEKTPETQNNPLHEPQDSNNQVFGRRTSNTALMKYGIPRHSGKKNLAIAWLGKSRDIHNSCDRQTTGILALWLESYKTVMQRWRLNLPAFLANLILLCLTPKLYGLSCAKNPVHIIGQDHAKGGLIKKSTLSRNAKNHCNLDLHFVEAF